jgi:hypothetical protein
MKWVYLFWSAVLLTGMALFVVRIAERSAGPLSPVFSFEMIACIASTLITPVVLLLRIFRVIKSPHSFIYIFMGAANLMIGIASLYSALDHDTNVYYGFIVLAWLNILFGLFIFIDAFVRTIPGYKRSK